MKETKNKVLLNLSWFVCVTGRGVFALKNIVKGNFICQYIGELIRASEGEKRELRSPSVYRYFFSFAGKKFWCVLFLLNIVFS